MPNPSGHRRQQRPRGTIRLFMSMRTTRFIALFRQCLETRRLSREDELFFLL